MLNINHRGVTSRLSLSICALITASQGALAQTAGTEPRGVLEEILVTASKRGAVSVQDLAGSITALGGDSLERTQVVGFEDYIKMVPGLTSVSSGAGQTQIIIRGVNANRVIHSASQVRSLAGLYLDEMPISIAGFNPDLGVVDVDRIEVLRGPQGTLYGASSMAGTIRVITKRPDTEEMSGSVAANVSDTKDGGTNYWVKGAANVPISDSVAMRVNAYTTSKDGFIDNVAPGLEEEDYNNEETLGGRMQVAYYGDQANVIASAIYNELETDGAPDEYLQDPDNPELATITDELQTIKYVNDTYEQEFLGFNLHVDYDFENTTLTSATSYFDVDISKHLDDTFRVRAVTPIDAPFSDYQAQDTYETVIQEIRLASNYESRFSWVLGAYYEDNDRDFVQTQPTPGTNAFFVSIGGPPPCPTLTSTCFGAVTDSVFDGVESVETTQYAVFGEGTYSFTDALHLKLGFRYFEYENDVSIYGAGPANGGESFDEDTAKEEDWVPKVELSYDVSEDHMVYATYSEGFRIGGVNGFVPEECRAELQALGSGLGAPYESDELTNFEIGAKTMWLDSQLIANLAIFQNQFTDIQSSVALDCGFTQEINAGEIENTGLEAEITYQATPNLQWRLGLSYVDSEVTEEVPSVNERGDIPPYVPEFTASGSVDYERPLFDGFGFARADVRYVDSAKNEFSSVPTATSLPSYTIVDLNIGYQLDRYTFGIFAKNAFDEEIITNIDPDRVQPNQWTRGMPRTIGISFSAEF